jgi:hypothetical protein
MKTNELRLGNLVMYNNQIVKTTGLHYGMFECGSPNNNNWMCTGRLSEVHPIELTEEILVKIGFEKFVKSFRMELSGCRLDYFIDKTLCIYKKHTNCCLIKDLKIKCEYIHQLQNSFFLLTGKELEVEL